MTLGAATIQITPSIAALGCQYRAWLVDIWGVMHNGIEAYPAAVEATRRFREQGGIVILLSNSPRPAESLQRQLNALGVTPASYDATVSSGDLTRHELIKRKGARVFHLGPERDLPIFRGLDLTLVPPEEADLVVCTGLFDDEKETPADYDKLLRALAKRDLPFLCANPDRMVERGRTLIYCAGALADIYEGLGGTVIYAGKPYAPVYDLAFETLAGIAGRPLSKDEVLAVGDGVHTDMAGAAGFGLDMVFIAGALHMSPSPIDDTLEELALAELFEGLPPPLAAMPRLSW
jgi:HAD superfamily hydrolase (TIGR01459 family)